MKRQLWATNFKTYFEAKTTFIASRDTGYQQEAANIEQLTVQAQERYTKELLNHILYYLRPWNLELEGNWIGREWLRMVAMQALCYLGSQNVTIEAYLISIASTNIGEWHSYDIAVSDTWRRLTDSSCLVDPYADFLRCLNEVLECIALTTESSDGEAKQ